MNEKKSIAKKAIKSVSNQVHTLDKKTKFLPEPSEKIYPHDRLLEKTVLKLFPEWVLPNHLTVFRLVATPLVAVLMYFEQYTYGLIAFLIVSFSDALDGSMARTRHKITEWGRVYDPIADKILIGSMVFIIVLRYIDFYTAMIIVALEIIIITAAWMRKVEGRLIQANIWGKIKMILQVFGVSFLIVAAIFNFNILLPVASGTFYLAIAFAILSLLTHGI